MKRRKVVIAAVLIACGVIVGVVEFSPRRPAPPGPAPGLVLRGKFVGGGAAEDAAAFAGVCGAVADSLEQDGRSPTPRITTGVQLEDLRTAIAEFRFAPRPLRERQPHVRAAVGKYLDDVAGTSGGPLDELARSRWVAAFRELSAAAAEAVQ